MDNYIYPAIFEPSSDGGYCITFPDLPECITEGDNLQDAMNMAKDALELFMYNLEDDNDTIPEPTVPEKIETNPGSFVVPIQAYMPLIREEMANRTIKKTLTLPKWLNDAAEKNNVNFSQILQAALKDYLKINNFN